VDHGSKAVGEKKEANQELRAKELYLFNRNAK